MRFTIFVKATRAFESGAMPSQELIEAMGKYNQELIPAALMQDGGACSRRPGARG